MLKQKRDVKVQGELALVEKKNGRVEKSECACGENKEEERESVRNKVGID